MKQFRKKPIVVSRFQLVHSNVRQGIPARLLDVGALVMAWEADWSGTKVISVQFNGVSVGTVVGIAAGAGFIKFTIPAATQQLVDNTLTNGRGAVYMEVLVDGEVLVTERFDVGYGL